MRESHNYGDCYFCGGEVKEKVIEVEFRWKGKLYILEGVPTGVCQQCGEKYFTAEVSKGGLRELGGEESVEDVYDLRVLGKGDFVQKVLESVGGLERPGIRKVSLEDLVSRISQTMRVEVSDLVSGSRRDNVSRARALIAYLAVRGMKYRGSEVGRILGLSEPGIMKCVDRGKRMLDDDYELSKLIS